MSEIDTMFDSMVEGVNSTVIPEVRSRWDSLKRLINENKEIKCCCELTHGTPQGQVYIIENKCPVHKGSLNDVQSCPCHNEDYKCVWHPERVTCGDTPCKNTGKDGRDLGNNVRVEGRSFGKSRF
jgi:hypothetical protein